jgi:hypothetical protein
MWEVMHACVIMNNTIIESESGDPAERDDCLNDFQGPLAVVNHQIFAEFVEFPAMGQEIRDEAVHHQLQNDPIGHMWAIK